MSCWEPSFFPDVGAASFVSNPFPPMAVGRSCVMSGGYCMGCRERPGDATSVLYPVVLAFDAAAPKILDCLKATDRASTLERYDLILKTLTGRDVDNSRDPKQALKIVYSVRDAIAHMKSQETEIVRELREEDRTPGNFHVGTWVENYPQPKFMRALESRGLLNPGAGPRGQWSLRISSQPFANWICETVEQAARDLAAQFPPDSMMRERLISRSLAGFSNDRRRRRHLRRDQPEGSA